MGVMGFVVAFLFYLVQYVVIFYANTALVGAAMIRLNGGDPTVRDGFRIANSRFGAIIGYALIAATVGMILKALIPKKGNGSFHQLHTWHGLEPGNLPGRSHSRGGRTRAHRSAQAECQPAPENLG